MKITKAYLKKLIKEEIAVMESDDDDGDDFSKWKENDFLQIKIVSDNPREISIRKVEEQNYKNEINYDDFLSLKALVKIEQIVKHGED